ncbi:hypothetical protein TCE0_022f06328 [Talaromyces pinophilus]|uniref:Uncharacterized protein n=1 Tax=Talaromyces pinophilus TaxID=128442 RepID=A0A6V8H7L7_TALPI|nr:hypothetical protein TCE0_022f06328 [Talaromyces pinophilus]
MRTSQSLVSQLRCVVLSHPVPRCAVRHNIRSKFGLRNYSTTKNPSPSPTKPIPPKAAPAKQPATKVNLAPKKPVKAVAAKPTVKYSPSQTWKPTAQKAAPENVLIYHAGTGRIVFLGMLRTATIFVAGVSSMIIAPAFFADEFPSYLAPLIVIGGALPLIFVGYTTAPFVNNIYIHLPVFARKSREAALEYVKSLPSTATLSIRTMKITTIPRTTEILDYSSTSHKSIFTSTFNCFKKPSSRNAKMAGDKGENVLNMSQSELKLIALGCRFSEGGKPDYEQIAKYGGYTKGSAQVMYRKALRKLTEAWPVDGDAAVAGSSSASSGPEIAGNNDPVTPSGKAKTPKTPRSRAASSGKKRKDVAGAVEDQDVTPSAGAQTPFTPGAEGWHEAGAMVMETPTKKPKKAPAKQAISRSFTSINTPDDDDFLKDEPLFEPAIKME